MCVESIVVVQTYELSILPVGVVQDFLTRHVDHPRRPASHQLVHQPFFSVTMFGKYLIRLHSPLFKCLVTLDAINKAILVPTQRRPYGVVKRPIERQLSIPRWAHAFIPSLLISQSGKSRSALLLVAIMGRTLVTGTYTETCYGDMCGDIFFFQRFLVLQT